jgi:hypothetical protein
MMLLVVVVMMIIVVIIIMIMIMIIFVGIYKFINLYTVHQLRVEGMRSTK